MALEISGYVRPGTYQREVIVPGGGSVAGTPTQVCIVSPGQRTKRIKNEAVARGLVAGETLTFITASGTGDSIGAPTAAPSALTDPPAGLQTLTDATATFVTTGIRPGARVVISNASVTGNNSGARGFRIYEVVSETVLIFENPNGTGGSETSSFTYRVIPFAPLANRALRGLQYLSLYRDGVLVPDSRVSFLPPVIRGSATATVNMTLATNHAFSLELDGNAAITVNILNAVTRTNTAAISAPASGIQTITDAGATFVSAGVKPGMTVTVTNATAPGDNGSFTILTVTETTLTYANAGGVGEAAGTLDITITGAGVIGRQVNVAYAFAVPAAATMNEIAAAIGIALSGSNSAASEAAVTALGFGPDYRYAAEETATGLELHSMLSWGQATGVSAFADVRVFAGHANDAVTSFFGASATDTRNARTFVELDLLSYNAGLTYTVDYIAADDSADDLVYTPTDVTAVGSQVGLSDYEEAVSWDETATGITWTPPAQASLTGTVAQADFTAWSADAFLKASVNGQAPVEKSLWDASPGDVNTPLGFTFGTVSTYAVVASNLNAWLANQYGPRYGSVASAVSIGAGIYLRLTAPSLTWSGGNAAIVGAASSVAIYAAAADDAKELVGIGSGAATEAFGTGRVPASGTTYYASYVAERPSSEYNTQRRFSSADQARAQLGYASSENLLQAYVELAFAQFGGTGSGRVVVVQVDDATVEGAPTRAEWQAALAATLKTDGSTEIVVRSTSPEQRIDLKDHIETANSPTVKRPRRGWFGMARNTEPGDRDTPDTFVYAARRSLQTAADSPGRGRLLLVAPPQLSGITRDVVLEDGTIETLELDSTALAVALAARRARTTDFANQAQSLAKKSLAGFNTADIAETDTWSEDDIATMASQGVMVVRFENDQLYVDDPITTEAGGGNLNAFKYESTSPQKDAVTRRVDTALSTLTGIVPTDLGSFIATAKGVIAGAIEAAIAAGDCGPYTTANGTRRAIDIQSDIEFAQNQSDPTKFDFKYWFNLRYPALRFFGEISVDAPFFGAAG